MFKVLFERLSQGHRRFPFLKKTPVLPERFRGLPVLNATKCADCGEACIEACPAGAISGKGETLAIDLGRCLFCPDCKAVYPGGAVEFSNDYRLAVRRRADLILRDNCLHLAEALDKKARSLFGRSLTLRQVSAGGCNACEADVNVLNTLTFDLASYGIQFAASPRHADGLLVTGPVTASMRLALEKTWQATPDPKLVIAVGACAISGGPYRDHPETANGVDSILPVDLYIPGCPPHPWTILDGLLRLLGRIR